MVLLHALICGTEEPQGMKVIFLWEPCIITLPGHCHYVERLKSRISNKGLINSKRGTSPLFSSTYYVKAWRKNEECKEFCKTLREIVIDRQEIKCFLIHSVNKVGSLNWPQRRTDRNSTKPVLCENHSTAFFP